MEFQACIVGRRSIRAFTARKVSRKTIQRVLDAANRSPSYMNTQPWEVFVASGDKKEAIAKALCKEASSGAAARADLPSPKEWPEVLTRRFMEHRTRRFKFLGIDPSDQQKVRESHLRNFAFYGAPCVLFIGFDKSLTPWSIFDLGTFTGSLLLAIHDLGLGAVPQAASMAYPDIVKKALNIPSNINVILSVAMGYPDKKALINQYQSQRRGQDDFVRWHME